MQSQNTTPSPKKQGKKKIKAVSSSQLHNFFTSLKVNTNSNGQDLFLWPLTIKGMCGWTEWFKC